jgi:hypothetical protein
MIAGIIVDANALHDKTFAKGAKVVGSDDFHFKDYFIVLKFFDNGVIHANATHDTFSDDHFEKYYYYFSRVEVIKLLKEEIKNLANKRFSEEN